MTKISKVWIEKIRDEWNANIPTLEVNAYPTLIHVDNGILMSRLLWEEYIEYKTALRESDVDIVEVADALGDMSYLLYGTVSQYGFSDVWELITPNYITNIADTIERLMDQIRNNNLEEIGRTLKSLESQILFKFNEHGLMDYRNDIIAEVHRSNLTKLTDGKLIMRDDMKVLKPKTFKEPDLSFVA